MERKMGSLKGKVAIVTGGSRGVGKGVALELGEAGATVYVTGRTTRDEERHLILGKTLPGTVTETAAEVTRLGGVGIPVGCNHRNDEEVKALFDRVRNEQGKLDILVNNAYQWHESILSRKGFWEIPLDIWDNQQMVGLRSAYVAAYHGAQIMVPQKHGLIVNVSSGAGGRYVLAVAYSTIKAALDRLSSDMAQELRPHNVASVALWPGPIMTEKTELLSTLSPVPYHAVGAQTPRYAGRAVVALAGDPNVMKKSGLIVTTTDLGDEYGFTEVDGSIPPSVQEIQWPPQQHYQVPSPQD